MNAKMFLSIAAVVATLYGIGFLLVPDTLFQVYGVASSPGALLGFRYFGVGLLSVGLILWFVRGSHEWSTLRGVLLGLIIANVVGVIVSAWGTMTGLMNAMGWTGVAIYLILLLGYAYIIKAGPRQSSAS
jgi:hypothetical protein